MNKLREQILKELSLVMEKSDEELTNAILQTVIDALPDATKGLNLDREDNSAGFCDGADFGYFTALRKVKTTFEEAKK